MSDDDRKNIFTDKYQLALWLQHMKELAEPARILGPSDEQCPICGGPIETLLDHNGKNPIRMCWKCDVEENHETSTPSIKD